MTFSRFRNLTFFAALIFISILFLYLLKPFLYPILWAAIIAGIFYPIYKKINTKVKRVNLSSLITILIVFILIIVPVIFLSGLVFKESSDLLNSLKNNQASIISTAKKVLVWVQNNTILQRLSIDEQAITAKLTEAATEITDRTLQAAKNLTQYSLTLLAMFIIMFYTLFFFLRDGEKILRRLAHLSPLGEKHEETMYTKFTSTARSVLKGTLIIGAVQGLLAGIMFYVVGIEGALIWGIITMLFSVIPGLGSYIIWLPAAVIMVILGNWVDVFILLGGGLIISTIDNLLRPILVGKETQMHPLLILFSTLGGLVIFGVSGFIIGPIIVALFLSLWEMYEQYFRQELDDDTNN